MKHITTSQLFDLIYNHADESGFLDDIKPIIDYASNADYNAKTLADLEISTDFLVNLDGGEGIYIDFYVSRGDKHHYSGCIKTLREDTEAIKAMGAAAALLQHAARRVLFIAEREITKN